MKRITFILLILLVSRGHSQNDTLTKDLSTLTYKKDQFNNNVFYMPYPNGYYQSGIYFYFQERNGNIINPRLYVQYYGDNWIFYDQIEMKIDGVIIRKSIRSERDVLGNGYVRERADISIKDKNDLNIIAMLSRAQTLEIRYSGKYYYDVVYTPYQLQAIQAYMEVYMKYNPPAPPREEQKQKQDKEKNAVIAVSFIIGVAIAILIIIVYNKKKQKERILLYQQLGMIKASEKKK